MSDLLRLDRLFVSQKAKLIELTNEYRIRDESGAEVGIVRQEGQSLLRKAARLVSSLDSMMTHRLAIYDIAGTKVCEIVRPRALMFSKLQILDGSGREVGGLQQARKVFKKVRFAIVGSAGQQLGEIRAENWRAWDFHIVDSAEREIGRITKKWAGVGKELFTTADNYMVEIDPSVTGDVRLLLLAAGAGIDTAIKQKGG